MMSIRTILFVCCMSSFLVRIERTQIYMEQDKWYVSILSFLLLVISAILWKIRNSGERLYPRILYSWYEIVPLGLLVLSLYGIFQYFSIFDAYAGFSVTGNFNNPGTYAATLSAGFPISLFASTTQRSKMKRCIYGTIPVFVAIAVALSGSRAGILSVLISIIFFLFIKQKITIKHLLFLFVSLIAVGITLYFYKKDSADGRLLIWSCSWEMFKDKPLLGFGVEGFWKNYMNYQANYFSKHLNSPFAVLADNTFRPFNEYITLLVNYGIIGLFMFISFVYFLWKSYKRNKRLETNIAATCLLSIGVYACFSYPLSVPFVWLTIISSVFTIFYFANYSIKIIVPFKRGIQVIIIFVSSLLIVLVSKDMLVVYRWSNTKIYPTKSDQFIITLLQYDKLYNELKSDYTFLYNYAEVLNAAGLCRKSLEITRECVTLCADYDLEILIGDNLIKTGNYVEAQKHFKLASNMCPVRFIPLYALFKIYQKTGKNDEAKIMAKKIACKSVKVSSFKIIMIKKEVENYLASTE